MSWWDRAACRGMTDLFALPELHTRHSGRTMGRHTRARIALARATCHECPVLQECAAYYAENPDRFMFAAGLTPEERRRAAKGVA